jgi:FKBP-type peptidyl-prolyl cis-trans isomerase SlyD
MLTVSDETVVSLDYILRLEGDEVVDTSQGSEPLDFIPGRGQLIPGLEQALYCMAVGDAKDVVVSPEEGYGEFDSDLFETLPREVFPADMELEEGLGFRLRTEDGEVAVAYIDTIEEDHVVVNLNHPLAGETLYFSVKIAGLRAVTPEDLACGCGCDSCGGDCGDEGCDCGEDGCDCECHN